MQFTLMAILLCLTQTDDIVLASLCTRYKGLGANLVGVSPEKAIKLGANDYFREQLGEVDGELSIDRSVC